ncbi:hypothetical protein MNB_SM-7-895 [hydrothermal vent metagenome]|uniref:Uncharacterized protein n=1 Tax=hydrothermal vent metagenome TaxID=652676 RepID=A0A1W1BIC8_9ZZZZ
MIFETIKVIAPEVLREGLSSGKLIRIGMIIKEASSGKIVGHMKEVGHLTKVLNSFPIGLDPLSNLSDIYQGVQLEQIKQSLETLQLISTVGAAASVATLGVSVAGFGIVINKLNKLDEKLDVVLENIKEVKEIVQSIKEDNDTLKLADLNQAAQKMDKALVADTQERRRELLTDANNIFSKYKQYYLQVAQKSKLWKDNELPIDISNELYSRYVTCALGELYSEFLLGDIASTTKTWEQINNELKSISEFDKKRIFRNYSDRAIKMQEDLDLDNLKSKIVFTDEMINETCNRVDSLVHEIKYIEKKKIKPIEYMKTLKNMDDGIIVFDTEQ